MKGFTGVCQCGWRRHIRKDGTTAPHWPGRTHGDCGGGQVVPGTERCEECHKYRSDYHATNRPISANAPIAHKLDCGQRGTQP